MPDQQLATAATPLQPEEVRLATRNHGFLLEALAYPTTPVGLHYLLTHFDVPILTEDAWELNVGGLVRNPCRLTLNSLRERPTVTRRVTMECAGNGRLMIEPRPLSQPWGVEAVGTGEWTGCMLGPLLIEAGISEDALEVVFTGADSGFDGGIYHAYQRSLSVRHAMDESVIIAYALNGQPLPPQHGFPARIVVPGWYGMANVKWLTNIEATATPFAGYQQAGAYRLRQDPSEEGQPLMRIQPRALMIPPGVPEFFSRERHLTAGPVNLQGRAWSGFGRITEVQVSVDGGTHWDVAALEPQSDITAWVGWKYYWHATVGTYDLCCRATDETGLTQPMFATWNHGGYANNSVQHNRVTVLEFDMGPVI